MTEYLIVTVIFINHNTVYFLTEYYDNKMMT